MDEPLILQLLPLIIILVILGFLIRVMVQRSRDEAASGAGITPGFKGWLILLALGVVLAPLRLLSDLVKYYGAQGSAEMFRVIPDVAYPELALNIVTMISALATMILMFGRKWGFRTAFYVQYGFMVVALPLNFLMLLVALYFRGIPPPPLDEAAVTKIAAGWSC